jgi:type II secretory ATPase GspE/PulE/Tfp pilus assembly ATPase PilB-like protein
MVLKGVDSTQIREVAKQRGMMTLLEYGLQRIKDGVTTLSEVLRVTQEL